MKTIMKNKFFSSKGLRTEMFIVVGLISLIMLGFAGYLFPGVFSFFERSSLPWTVIISVLFWGIIFVILWQIVDPIIKLSREVKKIANGDFNREIELFREDEIGQLGEAINRMTHRIKENVEELQNFSKTTEQINTEINKRILMLSHMLQISNLIAQNGPFKEIIDVGVGKCLTSGVMNFACLILKDSETSEFQVRFIGGARVEELTEKGVQSIKVKVGEGLMGKALLKQAPIVIDKETNANAEIAQFRSLFSVINAIIVPVTSKGNVYGLLMAGNDTKDFVFMKMDHELVQVVARQITIANTNELLQKEVEKLEVKDRLTDLFNQTYIRSFLNEEIKKAMNFQRPCSLLLLTIDRFDVFHDTYGHIAVENVLIKIGSVLKENLSAADKSARSDDHEFAVILLEKNKRQSIAVADSLRKKIEEVFVHEKDSNKRLTCTGAVTENPIDGVSADELIEKAREILKDAKKGGGNRICYKI